MTHFILPGSFEISDTTLTAGVHTGANDWDIKNLRYVSVDANEALPGDSALDLLGRIYDNSTGCLLSYNFKRNK